MFRNAPCFGVPVPSFSTGWSKKSGRRRRNIVKVSPQANDEQEKKEQSWNEGKKNRALFAENNKETFCLSAFAIFGLSFARNKSQ